MSPAKKAETVKKPRKRTVRTKKVKDVTFDISEISTAIDHISIKDQKVGIIFQGQEKEYIYNYSDNLGEFVQTVEKFVKEQHLSIGIYFNDCVKEGKLTQVK